MPPLSPARIVLSLLPAAFITIAAASTLWGDGGLFTRFRLKQQKQELTQEIVDLSAENARLLREIAVMDKDPRAVQREVADTIGLAPEGAVLYSFEGEAEPNGAATAP